jgi:hypothetical protein
MYISGLAPTMTKVRTGLIDSNDHCLITGWCVVGRRYQDFRLFFTPLQTLKDKLSLRHGGCLDMEQNERGSIEISKDRAR